MDDFVSSHEMAERLDITTRHLQELGRRGVLAPEGRGRWSVRATTVGYVKYLRGSARRGDDELQTARATLLTAQAKKAERALARDVVTEGEATWQVDFANTLAHHCFLTHQAISRRFAQELRPLKVQMPNSPSWRPPEVFLEGLVGDIACGELGALKSAVWNLTQYALAKGIRLTGWQELEQWMRRLGVPRDYRVRLAEEAAERNGAESDDGSGAAT